MRTLATCRCTSDAHLSDRPPLARPPARFSPFPLPSPPAEFLATAAEMAGDEVEDALMTVKKDSEEVPTRDRIKKALAPGADAKGPKKGAK